MKKILLSVIMLVTALTTQAQEESYWWVGLQGGAAMSWKSDFTKVLTTAPSASLSVGYRLSPEFDVRANVNTAFAKDGLNYLNLGDHTHALDYMTANLDFMPNLISIFTENENSPFSLYMILGLGYNIINENSNSKDRGNAEITGHMQTNDDLKGSMNMRAGLQLDYRFSKAWSVNIETAMNSSRIMTTMLGLNYRFNAASKKVKEALYGAPVTTANAYDAAAAEAEAQVIAAAKKAEAEATAKALAEKKAAEEATKKAEAEAVKARIAAEQKTAAAKKVLESIEKDVFFTIGKSRVTPNSSMDSEVSEAAAWMKKHETATATVTGYADKGTGSAEVNRRVSERRAVAVADALKAKGIDADRIRIESKGDTIQPFAENDKNRVAIIIAKEQ